MVIVNNHANKHFGFLVKFLHAAYLPYYSPHFKIYLLEKRIP